MRMETTILVARTGSWWTWSESFQFRSSFWLADRMHVVSRSIRPSLTYAHSRTYFLTHLTLRNSLNNKEIGRGWRRAAVIDGIVHDESFENVLYYSIVALKPCTDS